jgi:general secretion pathway protein A
MYERFYGLRERPFDLAPNPKFLFLSARHDEALTHLRYGLSGRPGITLLIGDAGTGKSTLIRAALQDDHARSRVATVSNPTLTRDEFYNYLAEAFGFSAEAAASKSVFLHEMEASIDACHAEGGVLALIVDEAQSLSHELLEELRLLTNTEGRSRRALSLLLVGQPELAERMNDTSLRQLKQRVALRATLAPFSLKETASYIAGRITVAGGRPNQLFTRDAIIAIHEAAKGLPRTISVICDNALVNGFATSTQPVGADIVAEVCADFDLAVPTVPIKPHSAPVALPPVEAAPAASDEAQPADEDAAEEPALFQSSRAASKGFSFFRGARR